MNLKLICASLVGVSSIGGAVAGGMYLSKSTTTKQENYSNTNTKPQPAKAQEAAPAPKNTVSSAASSVQGTPSSSDSTTSQAPLGG